MPEPVLPFPAAFKWGTSTAAYQVEGNNANSDWCAWEQQPGRIRGGDRSGLACDWWANAEADFDRAAALGLNALRLSVEWSRVEPEPGRFEPSTLERYVEIVQGLRERHIEPMVTLHHFSNPRWLAEQGGWESPGTIQRFACFVRRVVEALGPYCQYWCTLNEPNVYGYNSYVEGIFPPGKTNLRAAMRVVRHMLLGHATAYREIHSLQSGARVGLAHNMRVLDPEKAGSALDRLAAWMADRFQNEATLTALTRGRWILPLGTGAAPELQNTLDWIGLNYYTRDLIAFDLRRYPPIRRCHADDAEMLDGGYGEFYAPGMRRCLQRLAGVGLPVYVTENGLPDDDDDQRPRYLLTHLHQVWQAIQAGCPVQGYFHWTLVDNFEWAEGWTLRFGLFALDPQTQLRRPRLSAHLYAEIAHRNGITRQQINTYAPELRGPWTADGTPIGETWHNSSDGKPVRPTHGQEVTP